MSEEVSVVPLSPQGQSPDRRSIERILELAVTSKVDVATLEKLVALHERMSDRQAAREFAEAMSAFKAECPPVERRTENAQFKVSRNGVLSVRKYASLEDIERTVRGPLGNHGLSYRWTDAKLDGGSLTVTCVIGHVSGHHESSSATVPVDSKAGCSDQQKMGTAMTYAQRYSLIMALGLTSCDEDTDGNEDEEKVTQAHVEELEALIDKCPSGTRARLLAYTSEQWNAPTLELVPASRFEELKRGLDAKVKAQK